MSDQGFADQLFRNARHGTLLFRDLHAAGLPASTGMDLGFDDKYRGIQLIGPGGRSVGRGDFLPPRNWDAELRKERLSLKLMNVHVAPSVAPELRHEDSGLS